MCRRVQQRSGLPVCEIRQRMARQMDPQEKKARADFVIDNNKGLDRTCRTSESAVGRVDRRRAGKGMP